MSTVASKTDEAVNQAEPLIQKLAKVGYAAKGLVYVLIGTLALMPVIGMKGKATSEKGAIDEIANQPFGVFLLVAIGVGLLGYMVWRILMAIYNPEDRNAVKRIAYVVTALGYGFLGYLSLRAVTGQEASPGKPDAGQIGMTARLLEQPYGKLIVLALALLIFAVAVIQIVNAATAKFKEVLATERMSPEETSTAVAAGRIGLTARAVVFGVIAWFLAKAALSQNPQQAKGFAGALKEIAEAPYGIWLFGLTAAGLIAFGVFMFILAKYRRMTPVQSGQSR